MVDISTQTSPSYNNQDIQFSFVCHVFQCQFICKVGCQLPLTSPQRSPLLSFFNAFPLSSFIVQFYLIDILMPYRTVFKLKTNTKNA